MSALARSWLFLPALNGIATLDSIFDLLSERRFEPAKGVLTCDVQELEDRVEIHAEVPGATTGDVDIAIDDGVLTITRKQASEKKETKNTYVCRERSRTTSARSFELPEIGRAHV